MGEQGDREESRKPTAPTQVQTGVPGLDRLLNGGLREGGLHAVLGEPGTGKSVLAHQIGSYLIRSGGKVLYLTAMVESHQTLISQARTFGFFDQSVIPNSFYYASLYPMLAEGGLQATREEIGRLVAQHAPTLVVLDGVHAMKLSAQDPLDYQRFVHDLQAAGSVGGMTTLLLTHPPANGGQNDPTFTIADAIFHMRTRTARLREIRMFSVGKMRGVAHTGGWHTFQITGEGVHIYPRVESLAAHMEEHVAGEPPEEPSGDSFMKVDVDGLDEMLSGGLDPESVTLLVGTPGSGKTLFGLAFLTAGAAADEPGLLVAFHETPETLITKGEAAGLPVRDGVEKGMIHLHWRSPAELLVDREIERIMELVEEHKIKRVVIDALEDIRQAVLPRSRELFVLAALANLLRDKGVTTVVLQDLRRIVGVSFDMPMAELSALMDNALHLRYVEQKGDMKRLIAIIKVRARMHDHGLREFLITNEGLSVGKRYKDSEMVLTGLGLPR